MLTEDQLIRTYRSTIDQLYGLVHRWTRGDKALAEDIVQETYLRALSHWRRKGVPDNELAWLLTVARNLVISHFRRVQPKALSDVEENLMAALFDFEGADRRTAVGWGLSEIRSAYRRLLEKFYFDGARVREIAGEEGLSERAVEGRLRRARKALRAVLAQRAKEEKGNHG